MDLRELNIGMLVHFLTGHFCTAQQVIDTWSDSQPSPDFWKQKEGWAYRAWTISFFHFSFLQGLVMCTQAQVLCSVWIQLAVSFNLFCAILCHPCTVCLLVSGLQRQWTAWASCSSTSELVLPTLNSPLLHKPCPAIPVLMHLTSWQLILISFWLPGIFA